MARNTTVKLPNLIERKLYKTSQTRGADDDEIFQNRVKRNSTAIIPFQSWRNGFSMPPKPFENGFVVLISPNDYFLADAPSKLLSDVGLTLGDNCLIFYETRQQWNDWNPRHRGLQVASSRTAPLNGHFVARVPSTTRKGDDKIAEGFSGAQKGLGIRVYEYASNDTLAEVTLQLEALFWCCEDAPLRCAENEGSSEERFSMRRRDTLEKAIQRDLLDFSRLQSLRILNRDKRLVCPLCQKELSANGFMRKMAQAEGREVPDLTVTEINLFHIEELRIGRYNHRPYNLGWGCHHCNTVVRDMGLTETLAWMHEVLERNKVI